MSAASRPTPPTISAPKGQSGAWKTVMVIDPEQDTRKRVVALLRDAAQKAELGEEQATGNRTLAIHEAENGNAAWALVELVKPDLVVSEILLEGLSGLQLLRRLRERYGDDAPAVLFVTTMSNEVDRYWALRNKAMAYVIKPFDDDFLRSRAIKFFEDRQSGGLDLDANWIAD